VEFVALGVVANQTLRAGEDVVCELVDVGGRRSQDGFGEGAEEIGVASRERGGIAGAAERLDERHRNLVFLGPLEPEQRCQGRIRCRDRRRQLLERPKIDRLIVGLVARTIDQAGIQGLEDRIVERVIDAIAGAGAVPGAETSISSLPPGTSSTARARAA
jgi:hypothetical protein